MNMRTIQYAFWVGIPILIFLSLFSFSMTKQIGLVELLQQMPSLNFLFLLSCLFILYAHCMKLISTKVDHLKMFLLIVSIQQLCTLNLLGALISYLYFRQVPAKAASLRELYFSTSWVSVNLILSSVISVLFMWMMLMQQLA